MGPHHPHFSPANPANQASLLLIGATSKKQKGCRSLRILSGLNQPRTGSRSALEQRHHGPAGICGCREQLPRLVPELRPQRTPPCPHVSPLLLDEALWAAAREPHFQGIGAGRQARWKQLLAGKQERWVLAGAGRGHRSREEGRGTRPCPDERGRGLEAQDQPGQTWG